jgi:hypothetical protein
MPAASGLARKLNLKPGMQASVIGRPDGVDLGDVAVTDGTDADAVIAFAKTLHEVDANCAPVVDYARGDRLAWIAYPKAGQLGTDLNRDILWKHMQDSGIEAVRQVSLDSVWSALASVLPGRSGGSCEGTHVS